MSEGQGATGTEFVNTIGSAVRDNPLPAALIGMGLVWLFTGGRSSLRSGFGATVDGLSTVTAKVTDGAESAGSAIGDSAASAVEGVRAGLSVTTAQSTLGGLLQRQPLLLGAIGLAIGAGVGATLPTSQVETDYLGDASAKLQAKARAIANEQTQQATNVAAGVKTAITEEARVQGLTPDGLKERANEVEEKMKNLADYAGKAVQEKLQ
jgi:hypothetical protein